MRQNEYCLKRSRIKDKNKEKMEGTSVRQILRKLVKFFFEDFGRPLFKKRGKEEEE